MRVLDATEAKARYSAIVAGVKDTITTVPLGRFALLLVTEDEIDVRAVPDDQLEALIAGVIGDDALLSIVAKRDGLIVAPGYREHLVLVFELDEVEKAWEPPNVYAVGATHVTASVAPMGVA